MHTRSSPTGPAEQEDGGSLRKRLASSQPLQTEKVGMLTGRDQ